MPVSTLLVLIPAVLLLGSVVGYLVARLNLSPRLAAAAAGLATTREQLAQANGRITGLLDQLDQSEKLRSALAEENSRFDERLRQGERAQAALNAERAEFDRLKEENRELLTSQVLDLVKTFNHAQIDEGRKTLASEAKQQLGTLSDPIHKALTELMKHVREFESRNTKLQTGLLTEVQNVAEVSRLVGSETKNLTAALRKPSVGGAWGELSLTRALETLGLNEHCDFECQVTVTDKDGKQHRPDVVVHMSGERAFPMDAKAPMDAYLDIDSGTGEEAVRAGKRHAAALRSHVEELHRRAYHSKIANSADFTVLYLPLDGMLFTALEYDADLYQNALGKKILLATPTLLFGLLRAVEFGWRQAAVTENLQQIADLGQQLYDRTVKMADHLQKVGKSLSGAVNNYNSLVGNVQTRVLPVARKFADYGIGDRTQIELNAVELMPRPITSGELLASLPEPHEHAGAES
jgi:DNA recombination protein RmuC